MKIYTLTLSPAVDLIISLRDKYKPNTVNRAYDEVFSAGGKGINVSRVLKTLGRNSTAIAFVGELSGKFIEYELKRFGIESDFVYFNKPTRINVKLIDSSGTTEINTPNPPITKEDVLNMAKKLAKVKKDDVIIISGGLPKTISLEVFEKSLNILYRAGAYFCIDMAGKPLLRSLKFNPFLVKPNLAELEETLYIKTHNDNEIVDAAKRLISMGARNVIVTLGPKGAIFVNDELVIKMASPDGVVHNTSGAGDSFIAGFIDEFFKTNDYMKAFKKGIIVGAATAFSTDLTDIDMINEVSKKMNSKGGLSK